MTDQLKKYLLPDHTVRIQAVRLTDAWQTGLRHQHYPACVQTLLGELVAAAVLLTSNIKFDGTLVLQLQGDGPVALIVVECTAELSIRATVTLRDSQEIPADGDLQSLLNTRGEGRFIVILDPRQRNASMQPYQGIVPMSGSTVAQVLEHYMRSSEQLDTRLWLAADGQHSAGLLIQRLPDHGGNVDQSAAAGSQTWERLTILADTVKHDELISLDTDTVIKRLFWEEELLLFDPEKVVWHCPCNRERVANMLVMLGAEEVEAILKERSRIDIACNFCGKPYQFDAVDCAQLFIDAGSAAPAQASEAPPSIH